MVAFLRQATDNDGRTSPGVLSIPISRKLQRTLIKQKTKEEKPRDGRLTHHREQLGVILKQKNRLYAPEHKLGHTALETGGRKDLMQWKNKQTTKQTNKQASKHWEINPSASTHHVWRCSFQCWPCQNDRFQTNVKALCGVWCCVTYAFACFWNTHVLPVAFLLNSSSHGRAVWRVCLFHIVKLNKPLDGNERWRKWTPPPPQKTKANIAMG